MVYQSTIPSVYILDRHTYCRLHWLSLILHDLNWVCACFIQLENKIITLNNSSMTRYVILTASQQHHHNIIMIITNKSFV